MKEKIMKKQTTPLLLIAAIFLAALGISGCASMNKQNKALDETLKQFEVVVRWSQWDGAAGFLSPEYLEAEPISNLDMDRLRLFQVTRYEVRSAVPFNEGMGFRQVVALRMFNKNRAVEKSLLYPQEWHYNEEHQRWYLHSGLPDVTSAR
ncbi:MAG: hypothetical protein ACI9H8_002593 [Lysobacterales bacterium]|jgi:hypothetical protein